MAKVGDLILDTLLRLHPEDSKTNVCIPFSLIKDYGSLECISAYEPKQCDDRERAKQLIQQGLEASVAPEYRDRLSPWESFLPAVVNLVTLSLDFRGEYLGCAHRHDPQQRHIISADFSSPGFFRCAPQRGDWRAVINVHAVVSPELRYHLQIFAHAGGPD